MSYWIYVYFGINKWTPGVALGHYTTKLGAQLAEYEHQCRIAIQDIWDDTQHYTGVWVGGYDSYRIIARRVEDWHKGDA